MGAIGGATLGVQFVLGMHERNYTKCGSAVTCGYKSYWSFKDPYVVFGFALLLVATIALFLTWRAFIGKLHPAWAVGALFAGLLRVAATFVLRGHTGFDDNWLLFIRVISEVEASVAVVAYVLILRAPAPLPAPD